MPNTPDFGTFLEQGSLYAFYYKCFILLSYIYIVGSNPTQAQCNFSSEELHWVSHGVGGRKCQYFT